MKAVKSEQTVRTAMPKKTQRYNYQGALSPQEPRAGLIRKDTNLRDCDCNLLVETPTCSGSAKWESLVIAIRNDSVSH
eukprot:5329424-Amphidinium_carterae.1